MQSLKPYLLIHLCCIALPALAIDPVYEGDNGIREKVFTSNCLLCHTSSLTGSARQGAPASVNWDTYNATLPNATRAIVRAVQEMSMPPAFSGLARLNDEQKTAMSAWQNAGFPRYTTITTPATFELASTILTLPVVNVGDAKFRATLKLTTLSNSPTGYGFILDTSEKIAASSDTAATFFPETGQLKLPKVNIVNHDNTQTQVTAALTLVSGSAPFLFSLNSVQ